MKKLVLFLINFYQRYIRKVLPEACRYYPTCSDYTKESIIKKGVFLGLLLGFFRILRCNPLFKGGLDPVK